MKKFLVSLILALYSFGALAVVLQGETSPGVYTNIKADASGNTYAQIGHPLYDTGNPFTWLASAARTATTSMADQTNVYWTGITVYCNVSAVPGTDTVQVKVQGKESITATYFDVAAITATAATGLIIVRVDPRLVAVAASTTGVTSNAFLPSVWRISVVHSAASSFTYSCTYEGINY